MILQEAGVEVLDECVLLGQCGCFRLHVSHILVEGFVGGFEFGDLLGDGLSFLRGSCRASREEGLEVPALLVGRFLRLGDGVGEEVVLPLQGVRQQLVVEAGDGLQLGVQQRGLLLEVQTVAGKIGGVSHGAVGIGASASGSGSGSS